LVPLFAGAFAVTLAAAPPPLPRGGRVGWARLVTSHVDWGAHSDRDPDRAAFIRTETSLNIDRMWRTVLPGNLDQLCAYPFIYAKDVAGIRNPHDIANLREYVQHGGFICIDPCVSGWSASSKAAFIRQHAEWFARVLPGSITQLLPENHPLFRCYFNVSVGDLFTPDMVIVSVYVYAMTAAVASP
jgi:hypothetical protein